MELNLSEINLDDDMRHRLERLRSGCVLLAQDELTDPNFDGTIVAVCVYGEDGTYGVVLNRPSHMPLSEMFDGFSGMSRTRKVFIGGPVKQEELQILQITDSPVENAYRVSPRVYLGGQWSDLQQLLQTDECDSYLFLGYAGWSPGQLEYEIMAGAWEVFDVNLEDVLQQPETHWTGNIETIAEHLTRLTT